MKAKGILYVITGPMFAGKTSELLRLYDRSFYAKQKSLLIKSKIDKRYSKKEVVTHNKIKRDSIAIKNISEIKCDNYDNVFIDEVQFFDSKIIDFINDKRKKGINFYVSGLNQTSEGKAFPFKDKKYNMGDLLAMADYIKSLSAVCTICGKEATKTFKKIASGKEIQLGSNDLFEARCIEHWKPVL